MILLTYRLYTGYKVQLKELNFQKCAIIHEIPDLVHAGAEKAN